MEISTDTKLFTDAQSIHLCIYYSVNIPFSASRKFWLNKRGDWRWQQPKWNLTLNKRWNWKVGSKCELNSWLDSSVTLSIWTELIGRGFKFYSGQHSIATLNNPSLVNTIYEDGVVWLCHWLVNLYIWLTISSCYSSIPLTLGLIGRDDGLSTVCHSCRFACKQRVLKTFPDLAISAPRMG